MLKKALSIILLLFSVVYLVACESKLSRENFDKIEVGMSMQQVVKILGEPKNVDSIQIGDFSGASATWKDKNAVIIIQFLNNTVKIKTFAQANSSAEPQNNGLNY